MGSSDQDLHNDPDTDNMTRQDFIDKFNRRQRIRSGLVIAFIAVALLALVWFLIDNNPPHSVNAEAMHGDLDSLYSHGKQLMRDGNYDEALKVLTHVGRCASETSSPEDSDLASKAYNNAGVISFFNTNYSGAYSFYKKALEAGGSSHAYFVETNMGIIYLLFNDRERGEQLLNKAYMASKRASDWQHVNTAYYNLLKNGYFYDRADTLRNLLADYRNLPMPDNNDRRFILRMSEGVNLALDKHPNEAIKIFRKADSLAYTARQPLRGRIDCNLYIAKTFMDAGSTDSALRYFNRASQLADTSDMRDHLVDIYLRIADCYEKLGKTSDEMEFRRRYYSLKDSISSLEHLSAIRNLESNYETEKYENEITVMIAEKKMQSTVLIITLCFLAVTLLLLTITFRQKRKLKASNITLFEKNMELARAYEDKKAQYLEGRQSVVENTAKNEMKDINSAHDDLDSTEDNERVDENEETSDDKKTTEANVPEVEKQRILSAVKDFFYSSDEYLKPDFSLRRLCEIVGSNRLYVSSVLNNVMGTTFHSLLNEYRINEAKVRLLDTDNYGSMTIEAIAESLGYKSRSNFARNFKTYTGLTPSEFIAIAKVSNP